MVYRRGPSFGSSSSAQSSGVATDASGPGSDALPDQAGSDLSRGILDILGKRRTDLTPADAEVMQRVVDQIILDVAREKDEDAP